MLPPVRGPRAENGCQNLALRIPPRVRPSSRHGQANRHRNAGRAGRLEKRQDAGSNMPMPGRTWTTCLGLLARIGPDSLRPRPGCSPVRGRFRFHSLSGRKQRAISEQCGGFSVSSFTVLQRRFVVCNPRRSNRSPHVCIASRIGSSARPKSVNEYSTFGGICW